MVLKCKATTFARQKGYKITQIRMKRADYAAPMLELIEVDVECGFAASGDFTMPDGETNGDEDGNWA